MSEIILPKKYESRSGDYAHLNGKYKLSYSQYSSYSDEQYQNDYYVQYFLGIRLPSGEFAEFGSAVGEYIEYKAKGELKQGLLSEEDMKVIDSCVDFPDGCVYEDEVALDLGDFVVEGYIDRSHYLLDNKIAIRDYKTLNIDKKADFYASDEYGQTTLYCYFKETQGFQIETSEVLGLGRKGTSLNGTGNWKMRLSGEYKIIPTPYSKERAEQVINKIKQTAEKISDEYKIFLKLFA